AHLHPSPFGKFRRIANLKPEAHFLRLLVEQQDGKNFVVDDLADDFSNPAQRGVEVQRRSEHVGDIEQQRLGRGWVRFGNHRTHAGNDSSQLFTPCGYMGNAAGQTSCESALRARYWGFTYSRGTTQISGRLRYFSAYSSP